MSPTRHISAMVGDVVTFQHVGISVVAAFDSETESPYVSINTEGMRPRDTYDEKTGLRGNVEPFDVVEYGELDHSSWDVVKRSQTGADIVASFPFSPAGRVDATAYAATRNATWAESCGMPILDVHLNDGASIYSDQGEGNTAHLTEQVVELVRRMAAVAAAERDADVERWESVDQDTEEIEQSGYLDGYAHALQTVLATLAPALTESEAKS